MLMSIMYKKAPDVVFLLKSLTIKLQRKFVCGTITTAYHLYVHAWIWTNYHTS